jgi:hypothetical protein
VCYTDELAPDKWPQVLGLCDKYSAGQVLLTGGEPLEYEPLVQLIEMLTLHGVRHAVHTNGWGKYSSVYLEYVAANPGVNSEAYVSMELFEDLQKMYRHSNWPCTFIQEAIDAEVAVEAKMVLTRVTAERKVELTAALRKWEAMGVKSIRMQPVVGQDDLTRGLALDTSSLGFLEELISIKRSSSTLSHLLRNTEESLIALYDYLDRRVHPVSQIAACRCFERIQFVDANLTLYDCRTLWGKSPQKSCYDNFDLACCGFF